MRIPALRSAAALVAATFLLPAAALAVPPGYITQWGSAGNGSGQFNAPFDVKVGAGGNVYVADDANYRIQVFTASGTYVFEWPVGNACELAITPAGDVHEADYGSSSVQVFTSTGVPVTQWGGYGTGNGQFQYISVVALDGSGDVYAMDWIGCRVQKFTGGGAYLTQWGSNGSGNGQFVDPYGIAVGAGGTVYVVDRGNSRVQEFGQLATPARSTTWGGLKALYR